MSAILFIRRQVRTNQGQSAHRLCGSQSAVAVRAKAVAVWAVAVAVRIATATDADAVLIATQTANYTPNCDWSRVCAL